jgi:hypothetical protein
MEVVKDITSGVMSPLFHDEIAKSVLDVIANKNEADSSI